MAVLFLSSLVPYIQCFRKSFWLYLQNICKIYPFLTVFLLLCPWPKAPSSLIWITVVALQMVFLLLPLLPPQCCQWGDHSDLFYFLPQNFSVTSGFTQSEKLVLGFVRHCMICPPSRSLSDLISSCSLARPPPLYHRGLLALLQRCRIGSSSAPAVP